MSGEASSVRDGLPDVGTVLDGKYRIDGVLGVGGMGAVLEATHLTLEEKVAIKVLLGELTEDPEVVARFTREAWAAAKIKSENVARVHDVGALPSGSPYLVMEFLEGADLEQIQHERGTLGVAETVDYLLQACRALAEAHAQGIIHRDLKPGNLFRVTLPDGSPQIKVVDFGISKVGAAGDVTKTGVLMGSPVYMAPEQLLSSKDVDVTADVWSLGVILFELIAGEPPFDAATLPLLCSAVMADPTPSLQAVAPHAPAGLDAVVARCLEKDPLDRYPNLAELASALAPFAGPKGPRSAEYVARVLGKATRRIGTPKAAGQAMARSPRVRERAPKKLERREDGPEATAPPRATPSPRDGHPRRWMAGLAVAVVALAAGLTLWWVAPSPDAEPDRPPEEPSAPSVAKTADGATPSSESTSPSPDPEEDVAAAPPASASASFTVAATSPPPPVVAQPSPPRPPPSEPPAPPPPPDPPPPTDDWGKFGRTR